MRCETSVGNALRGSVLDRLVSNNGPGAFRLLAPARVGEVGLDAGREGARLREGVPGADS